MNKVIKYIFNALLVLIIIVLAGYLILRVTNKVRIYNVETGSMEYEIHTGDYILLLQNTKYHIGDIVTYINNEYFITHRIIKIDGDQITTKGDANNQVDEDINVSQVIGKVIYCGGILNFIIKFKFVIIAFLIGLYLLSCYFEKDENKIEKN